MFLKILFVIIFSAIATSNSIAQVRLLQSFAEQNSSNGDSIFGTSVASAGDVNKDTVDDIIVGAKSYNSDQGRAYIYYGSVDGTPINSDADVIFPGSGNQFGAHVSGVGDVNNDGIDDVVIATRSNAYLYLGGSGSIDNSSDVTFSLSNFVTYTNMIAPAGDVNHDGYDDVIVGNKIFFGDEGLMDNTADVIFPVNDIMKSAGDVDKDGFDDVLSISSDHIELFYGSSGVMDTDADAVFTGRYAAASAGDVNHDGYDDIITGDANHDDPDGIAYIYFGARKTQLDTNADIILSCPTDGLDFGARVACAGDVNNDGYDDVIVGTEMLFLNDFEENEVHLFLGGNPMNNTADAVFSGGGSTYFNISISGAGDINNDNYDDIIIGQSDYGGSQGAVFIYYGSESVDEDYDLILTGEGKNNNLGYSVACAGDVNNDGYDDVIVSAKNYDSSRGRIYLYYGSSTTMDNTADILFTGTVSGGNFGYSISSAGDVNNDHYDDIIIGAQNEDNGTGRAYIYFGSANMDTNPDVILSGENENDKFGCSVSSAGDVNKDGYDDVIVGANRISFTLGMESVAYIGMAYVYLGGSPMNNDYEARLSPKEWSGQQFFGTSVAGAGDVNGDGYDDVIVGEPGYDPYSDGLSSDNLGRAYIYYGNSGAGFNDDEDVVFVGETNFSSFGSSVSTAGDFNQDGYDDFIIGAESFSNNKGQVSLYFGAPASSQRITPDLIFTGENSDDYFGSSISKIGDINNDGASDILIGAYGYDSNTGRVYIFLGSNNNTYDNTADLIFTGNNTGDYFGYSIAGAGHINDDSIPDLIIGAYGEGLDGKAYLYFCTDLPVGNNEIISIDKNNSHTFAQDDFTFSDLGGGSFEGIRITSLETEGFLQYDGNDVTVNMDCDDITKLIFTPMPDTTKSPYSFFDFKVKSDNYFFSDEFTMTINVNDINSSPTATNRSVTGDEDTQKVFDTSEFNYSDIDDDEMQQVLITKTVFRGILYNDADSDNSQDAGELIADNTVVAKADIDAGQLKFIPVENANGSPYTILSYKVHDGTVYSESEYNLIINITAVNDPPTAADGEVTTDEDVNFKFSSEDFNFSDVDGHAFEGIKVTELPAKGTFLYDGNNIATGDEAANLTKLTFEPSPDEFGTPYTTFKFMVKDESGSFSVSEYTMTINVKSVDDANVIPVVVTNSGCTVSEGGTFTFSDAVLSARDGDDPTYSIIYNILKSPAHGSLALNGSLFKTESFSFTQNDIANGKVTYTHNGDESETDVFRFTVSDDKGGSSPEYNFDITIVGANEPPVVDSLPAITIS